MSDNVLIPAVLTMITSFPRIITIMRTSMEIRNANGSRRLKSLGILRAT